MAKKDEVSEVEAAIDTNWPAWRYGPGGVGEIFNSADEVPEGWVDHPSNALPALDL